MPYNSEGVGHANTDTSENAAAEVDAKTIRKLVLKILEVNDPRAMTADEISRLLDIPGCSVRPRLSELRNSNEVRDSGVRRKGNWGKPMICWQLWA